MFIVHVHIHFILIVGKTPSVVIFNGSGEFYVCICKNENAREWKRVYWRKEKQF